MTLPERLKRSPVRVFERATQGGLGRGNLGLIISRPGVGKTAFLIGLAVDSLLQGRKVLHISTQEPVARLTAFYDHIFQMLADSVGLEHRWDASLEIERNRHILVYDRKTFSLEKLARSVAFLRESAQFDPSFVIMDGTPRFGKTETWEMEGLQRLAQEWEAEIWTSSHTHREGQQFDPRGVPQEIARYDGFLSLILSLDPDADHVHLRIVKDRDRDEVAALRLELDPKTLLLRWR